MASKRTHLDDFFLLARAQSSRCAGAASGDKVLDAMPVIGPTAPARLEAVLRGYPLRAATMIVIADWWLGGALSQEKPVLFPRINRWVTQGYNDLEARMDDLVVLAGMGIVPMEGDAPARRLPWAAAGQTIEALSALTVGSMQQVHDVVAPTVGMRNALHLVRLLRPAYGDLATTWVSVSPGAACGLSWAMKGVPHGLFPSDARQVECRAAALDVLAEATEERWPTTEELPWTIDTIVLWAEFVWGYLQVRYPQLVKPRAVR